MNGIYRSARAFIVICFFAGVSVFTSAATEPAAAQTLIIESSNQLIDALQKQSAEIKQDKAIAYNLVDEIVLPHIDFSRISRLVLGKYWRRANATQKEQFTAEFKNFLVRTYVTAMVEFSDKIVENADRVKYTPLRVSDDENVTVRMEVSLENRPPVHINYSLYLKENDWMIYDLQIEGISLAATYRSSFSSEVRRLGLDGLISKLAKRNNKAQASKVAAEE